MQDKKNDLPEGTDKVIVGASSTTPATRTPQQNEESDIMVIDIDERGPTSGGASTRGRASGTSSATGTPGSSGGKGAVIEKIRSGGEKLTGQAADKARGLVSQGLERGAEALANVGRMVGDTAEGIDERLGAEYGDYARRAATAIEDAANNLAGKDADELIDDTRNFVRKSPGVALAGAAVVGFALARLVKAGLDRDTDTSSKKGRSGGPRED